MRCIGDPHRIAAVQRRARPLDGAGIESEFLPPGGPTETDSTDFPVQTDETPAGRAAMGPQPGWYAVSVNYLRGVTWTTGIDYRYFEQFTPVAAAGYSILIYQITPDEANALREQLRLPQSDQRE